MKNSLKKHSLFSESMGGAVTPFHKSLWKGTDDHGRGEQPHLVPAHWLLEGKRKNWFLKAPDQGESEILSVPKKKRGSLCGVDKLIARQIAHSWSLLALRE